MIKKFPNHEKCKLCVIGLGYVGLPLALEFSKTNKEDSFINTGISRNVVGFDIDSSRINDLKKKY